MQDYQATARMAEVTQRINSWLKNSLKAKAGEEEDGTDRDAKEGNA
jgi:hypothetical protein